MIYAVNTRSKEHRVSALGDAWLEEDWDLVQADADGWIEHDGKECPLPVDVKCEFKTKAGLGGEAPAGDLYWDLGAEGGSIIAYRPILDADTKPEPPEWEGGGLPPVGCECEMSTPDGWVRATIVFSDGDIAIGRIHDGQHTTSKCDWSRKGFRPIRSEEDRAIEEMVEALQETGYINLRSLMRALYRAGYRKAAAP